MAERYTRDYRDYLIDISDRVEFTAYGTRMYGTVDGRGFAGEYLAIAGDDGVRYEAHSGDADVRKLFDGDEGYWR